MYIFEQITLNDQWQMHINDTRGFDDFNRFEISRFIRSREADRVLNRWRDCQRWVLGWIEFSSKTSLANFFEHSLQSPPKQQSDLRLTFNRRFEPGLASFLNATLLTNWWKCSRSKFLPTISFFLSLSLFTNHNSDFCLLSIYIRLFVPYIILSTLL